jgi:hypothetical protein
MPGWMSDNLDDSSIITKISVMKNIHHLLDVIRVSSTLSALSLCPGQVDHVMLMALFRVTCLQVAPWKLSVVFVK